MTTLAQAQAANSLVGLYLAGVTPPPPPPGFVLPAPAPGFKRVLFEPWTTTTLQPANWSGFYNGRSGGAQPGFFVASHGVLKGDGWARFLAYPDPTGLQQCWKYDATIAATVNQWGGCGLQSTSTFSLPMNVAAILKWDTMPGMTPIELLIGRVWPPEIDIAELNALIKGGVPQPYNQTFHYATPDQRLFANVKIAAGTDLSQEHLWQFSGTLSGSTTTVTDATGNVVATCTATFSAAMVANGSPNSLANPMNLCFQHQTGDPSNPPVDPSVTAANPITFYVGSVSVDVPA